MRNLGILLAMTATLAAAGCDQDRDTVTPISTDVQAPDSEGEIVLRPRLPEDAAGRMSEENATECREAGGTVSPQGMLQHEMCVIRYPDANKPCEDSDQCQGLCVTYDRGIGPGPGVCTATNIPYGCYAFVEDGVADASICRD